MYWLVIIVGTGAVKRPLRIGTGLSHPSLDFHPGDLLFWPERLGLVRTGPSPSDIIRLDIGS
jgi:hypothetical protein